MTRLGLAGVILGTGLLATPADAAGPAATSCSDAGLWAYFDSHWPGVRRELQNHADKLALYHDRVDAYVVATDATDKTASAESEDPGEVLAAAEATAAVNAENAYNAGVRAQLYTLQANAEAFLAASITCRRLDLFADILELYERAETGMSEQTHYFATGLPHSALVTYARRPLRKPARMWVTTVLDEAVSDPSSWVRVPIESLLGSAKVVYGMARAMSFIASLPRSERTRQMSDFVESYWDLITDDHLARWLFRGPGEFIPIKDGQSFDCDPEERRYNLRRHFRKLRRESYSTERSYCNAMRDSDLIMVNAVAEVLAANAKDPSLAPLSRRMKRKYGAFLRLSVRLIRSRLSTTELVDFANLPVRGVLVDRGYVDDMRDYRCAEYTGTEPWRAKADGLCVVSSAEGLGWDVNHTKSLVTLVRSLDENRDSLRRTRAVRRWPNAEFMGQLANQVAYAVLDDSTGYPRFRNYLDGTNGWYRVDDGGAGSKAYGPWSRSDSYLGGGWSVLGRYNGDLENLNDRLLAMLSVVYFERESAAESEYNAIRSHMRAFFGVVAVYPDGVTMVPKASGIGNVPEYSATALPNTQAVLRAIARFAR